MKTRKLLILATVGTMGWVALGSDAQAVEDLWPHRLTLNGAKLRLADNVVVTPSGGTPPGGNVQNTTPAPAVPAQQTAVVESPRSSHVVHSEVEPNHNYMGTVAVSALMGGLVGVLVGGSIYFLGDQTHARNIAYWGAGGVLLGVGVGVVQIVVQEDRVSNATALNKLPGDPAPTLRLALWRTSF